MTCRNIPENLSENVRRALKITLYRLGVVNKNENYLPPRQHFGFFEDWLTTHYNTCCHFSLSHVLISNFTSSSRYKKICIIGVQDLFCILISVRHCV